MTTPISTAPDTLDFADYLAKDTPLFGTQPVSSASKGLVYSSPNTSPFQSAKDLLPHCITIVEAIFSNRSLALRDESLYGVNPYAKDLGEDIKAKILAECHINPMYFLTITDSAQRNDREGYGVDLSHLVGTNLN